jgi:hypothetical protein
MPHHGALRESFMTRSMLWNLILIAVLAVGIRLAYQAGMQAFGGDFNNGSDSNKYINVARTITTTGIFGNTTAEGTVEPATSRLPVYMYFLAGIFKLSHSENLRLVVTIQAFLEFFSVMAIGIAALAISDRMVIPAATMAALIPNFIAQSSYILEESVFLVFFTWGLCALLWAVRAKRPVWLLISSGLFFGLALITRLALVYYWLFLVPALFYALTYRGQRSWLASAALAVLPMAAMYAVAAPIIVHNYVTYGYAAISSQSGSHILNWFYGCLATPQPCTGRVHVLARLNEVQNAAVQRLGGEHANPFAISAFQSRLAFQLILQLPPWQIAWGMTFGIIKTLFQTGFYDVLSQFNQPTTFFSTVKGANIAARIVNFAVINRANYFMMMWVMAQVCLVVSRIFQFYGLFEGLRSSDKRPYAVLLFATAAYFLLIVGPVSSPRYRVPAEPELILFFALGFACAIDRFHARKPLPSAAAV